MAWRKILALGLVTSATIVGCSVSTTNNYNGGDGSTETGGSTAADSGTGGKGTGGAATGGAGGSTATGGKTGDAGGTTSTGGTTSKDSGPATCDPSTVTGLCNKCLATKCCQELVDCGNDKDCGESTTDAGPQSELVCIHDCMLGDAGAGTATIAGCAAQCKHGSATVSEATNALINCIGATINDASTAQNCSQECFGQPI